MRPRLNDLNQEGVSGEFVYTSAGMWTHSMRDPKLILAGCEVVNEWAIQCQRFSRRHVCTGMIPMLSVETVVSAVSGSNAQPTWASGSRCSHFADHQWAEQAQGRLAPTMPSDGRDR